MALKGQSTGNVATITGSGTLDIIPTVAGEEWDRIVVACTGAASLRMVKNPGASEVVGPVFENIAAGDMIVPPADLTVFLTNNDSLSMALRVTDTSTSSNVTSWGAIVAKDISSTERVA